MFIVSLQDNSGRTIVSIKIEEDKENLKDINENPIRVDDYV